MSRSRASRSLLFLGGLTLALSGSCAQPRSNTRCVFESGDLATGRCLTRCESQCSLEARAGCAPTNCVEKCDQSESPDAGPCADARYVRWRCLRLAGLPLVDCSGGTPSLVVPEGACGAELEDERASCPVVDAGSRAEAGIR